MIQLDFSYARGRVHWHEGIPHVEPESSSVRDSVSLKWFIYLHYLQIIYTYNLIFIKLRYVQIDYI